MDWTESWKIYLSFGPQSSLEYDSLYQTLLQVSLCFSRLVKNVKIYFVIFQASFTVADKVQNDNSEISRKKLILRGSRECSQLSADQCNNSEENQEGETG